jgi:hypothetical protein
MVQAQCKQHAYKGCRTYDLQVMGKEEGNARYVPAIYIDSEFCTQLKK